MNRYSKIDQVTLKIPEVQLPFEILQQHLSNVQNTYDSLDILRNQKFNNLSEHDALANNAREYISGALTGVEEAFMSGDIESAMKQYKPTVMAIAKEYNPGGSIYAMQNEFDRFHAKRNEIIETHKKDPTNANRDVAMHDLQQSIRSINYDPNTKSFAGTSTIESISDTPYFDRSKVLQEIIGDLKLSSQESQVIGQVINGQSNGERRYKSTIKTEGVRPEQIEAALNLYYSNPNVMNQAKVEARHMNITLEKAREANPKIKSLAENVIARLESHKETQYQELDEKLKNNPERMSAFLKEQGYDGTNEEMLTAFKKDIQDGVDLSIQDIKSDPEGAYVKYIDRNNVKAGLENFFPTNTSNKWEINDLWKFEQEQSMEARKLRVEQDKLKMMQSQQREELLGFNLLGTVAPEYSGDYASKEIKLNSQNQDLAAQTIQQLIPTLYGKGDGTGLSAVNLKNKNITDDLNKSLRAYEAAIASGLDAEGQRKMYYEQAITNGASMSAVPKFENLHSSARQLRNALNTHTKAVQANENIVNIYSNKTLNENVSEFDLNMTPELDKEINKHYNYPKQNPFSTTSVNTELDLKAYKTQIARKLIIAKRTGDYTGLEWAKGLSYSIKPGLPGTTRNLANNKPEVDGTRFKEMTLETITANRDTPVGKEIIQFQEHVANSWGDMLGKETTQVSLVGDNGQLIKVNKASLSNKPMTNVQLNISPLTGDMWAYGYVNDNGGKSHRIAVPVPPNLVAKFKPLYAHTLNKFVEAGKMQEAQTLALTVTDNEDIRDLQRYNPNAKKKQSYNGSDVKSTIYTENGPQLTNFNPLGLGTPYLASRVRLGFKDYDVVEMNGGFHVIETRDDGSKVDITEIIAAGAGNTQPGKNQYSSSFSTPQNAASAMAMWDFQSKK